MFLHPRTRVDKSRRGRVEEFDLDLLPNTHHVHEEVYEEPDEDDSDSESHDSSDDQDFGPDDEVSSLDSDDLEDDEVFIYDDDYEEDEETDDVSRKDFISSPVESLEDVRRHYMVAPPPIRDSPEQYIWPWLD